MYDWLNSAVFSTEEANKNYKKFDEEELWILEDALREKSKDHPYDRDTIEMFFTSDCDMLCEWANIDYKEWLKRK